MRESVLRGRNLLHSLRLLRQNKYSLICNRDFLFSLFCFVFFKNLCWHNWFGFIHCNYLNAQLFFQFFVHYTKFAFWLIDLFLLFFDLLRFLLTILFFFKSASSLVKYNLWKDLLQAGAILTVNWLICLSFFFKEFYFQLNNFIFLGFRHWTEVRRERDGIFGLIWGCNWYKSFTKQHKMVL